MYCAPKDPALKYSKNFCRPSPSVQFPIPLPTPFKIPCVSRNAFQLQDHKGVASTVSYGSVKNWIDLFTRVEYLQLIGPFLDQFGGVSLLILGTVCRSLRDYIWLSDIQTDWGQFILRSLTPLVSPMAPHSGKRLSLAYLARKNTYVPERVWRNVPVAQLKNFLIKKADANFISRVADDIQAAVEVQMSSWLAEIPDFKFVSQDFPIKNIQQYVKRNWETANDTLDVVQLIEFLCKQYHDPPEWMLHLGDFKNLPPLLEYAILGACFVPDFDFDQVWIPGPLSVSVRTAAGQLSNSPLVPLSRKSPFCDWWKKEVWHQMTQIWVTGLGSIFNVQSMIDQYPSLFVASDSKEVNHAFPRRFPSVQPFEWIDTVGSDTDAVQSVLCLNRYPVEVLYRLVLHISQVLVFFQKAGLARFRQTLEILQFGMGTYGNETSTYCECRDILPPLSSLSFCQSCWLKSWTDCPFYLKGFPRVSDRACRMEDLVFKVDDFRFYREQLIAPALAAVRDFCALLGVKRFPSGFYANHMVFLWLANLVAPLHMRVVEPPNQNDNNDNSDNSDDSDDDDDDYDSDYDNDDDDYGDDDDDDDDEEDEEDNNDENDGGQNTVDNAPDAESNAVREDGKAVTVYEIEPKDNLLKYLFTSPECKASECLRRTTQVVFRFPFAAGVTGGVTGGVPGGVPGGGAVADTAVGLESSPSLWHTDHLVDVILPDPHVGEPCRDFLPHRQGKLPMFHERVIQCRGICCQHLFTFTWPRVRFVTDSKAYSAYSPPFYFSTKVIDHYDQQVKAASLAPRCVVSRPALAIDFVCLQDLWANAKPFSKLCECRVLKKISEADAEIDPSCQTLTATDSKKDPPTLPASVPTSVLKRKTICDFFRPKKRKVDHETKIEQEERQRQRQLLKEAEEDFDRLVFFWDICQQSEQRLTEVMHVESSYKKFIQEWKRNPPTF